MSINDRVYRTCTYIAGDWTGDSNLIEKLHEWNKNDSLGLSFVDVHDLTQSRDTSNPCSIKQSLRKRLNVTKTFVLIVGSGTNSLTKGSCRYCSNYVNLGFIAPYCKTGGQIDNRSFIDYECEMALKDFKAGLIKKIVVIYNGCLSTMSSRCPSILRKVEGVTYLGSDRIGTDGKRYWNYTAIKNAICG